MKQNLKITVIAIVWAISGVAKGQIVSSFTELDRDNFYVSLSTFLQSEKLKVLIESQGESAVLFMLNNEKGASIFKRKISKDKLRDNFTLNLEHLADGNYVVEISDRLSKAKKIFKKETEFLIAKPIIVEPSEPLVALD